MLTLHHAWASTCSQKVRLCLAEKGAEWSSHVLDLRALEHLDPAFLALNPDGMVPVLEHDGFVLTESTVINEYLEEILDGPRLLPADAQGRARVRTWTQFVDAVPTDAVKVPSYQYNLAPAIRQLDAAARTRIRTEMPNRETARRWLRLAESAEGLEGTEMARAVGALARTLERMCAALARTPWLAGDAYTLADVNMAPFVHRLCDFDEFDLAHRWPPVQHWLEAVRARPAFAVARFPAQRIGSA